MRARLVCVVIPPLLMAAFVGAQDRSAQPGQTGDRDRAGQPGGAGTGGHATALDGTWTVVSAARDGKAVDGAGKLTVSIKNNVATFAGGAGGADKGQMRALRLDFGPQGTVRVSEANADGKFDGPGGTGGTGTPGGDPKSGGTGTPPAATGSQPGGTGAGIGAAGLLRGVYVLTPDFLAISVFDTGTGSDAGTSTPGSGTTPGGGIKSGGSGTTQPGGTGTTTTQPGGTGTTPQAGTSAAGAAGGPQIQSRVSVILKRSGAAAGDAPGGAGTPGGTGK